MWRKSFYFHEIVYAFLSPFPIPSHPCWLMHRLPGPLAYWSYYYYYLLLECQLGRLFTERKVHHAQTLIMENKVVEAGIKVILHLMLFLGRGWRQYVLMELAGNFHCRVFVFSKGKSLLNLDLFFFFPNRKLDFKMTQPCSPQVIQSYFLMRIGYMNYIGSLKPQPVLYKQIQ